MLMFQIIIGPSTNRSRRSAITLPTVMLNTTLISDGAGNFFTRTAGVIVNGYGVYVSIARK
jgi:hypothetical protein